MESIKQIDDKKQLCKIGDKLYRITKIYKTENYHVEPITIVSADFTGGPFGHWYYHDDAGRSYFNRNIFKNCFETAEEAEKEIIRRGNIVKKRGILKEYERKLNEELNIGNHFIIK